MALFTKPVKSTTQVDPFLKQQRQKKGMIVRDIERRQGEVSQYKAPETGFTPMQQTARQMELQGAGRQQLGQQEMLNQMLMERALGQAPSMAQLATKRAVGQQTAGQQSIIGGQRSARGGLANIARQRAAQQGQEAIAQEAGMAQLAEQQAAQQLAGQQIAQQQQLGLQAQQMEQQAMLSEAQRQQQAQQFAAQQEQKMTQMKMDYDQAANQQRLAALQGDTAAALQLEQIKQQAFQSYQASRERRDASKIQFVGGILGGLGAAAGMYFGGPAGAMAGQAAGQAVGGAVAS